MKTYLTIKFHEDCSNKKLIEDISDSLKMVGIETYVMARDFEKWGKVKNIESGVLMTQTFKIIDESDFVIIEFSEKGVGLGIEAGYAYAKGKPVYIIAKHSSDVSNTLKGIAKEVIFYNTPEELEKKDFLK